MNKINKFNRIVSSGVVTLLLMLTTGATNAALVNYTITGDVVDGSTIFGLASGDTITATGTFDDSVLTSGSGIIDFSDGSGNTMTINVGTNIFTAANDISFSSSGPFIELDSLLLSDFDFLAELGTNGATADFSSFFTEFDDAGTSALFGEWRTDIAITPVPVPAAVWLFGSGLLGLVGIARRKTA